MGRFKKQTITYAMRREVALRAGAVPGERAVVYCEYCGAEGSAWWPFNHRKQRVGNWVHFRGLELDHVLPEFQGGPTDASNLVLACRPCNRAKGRWDRLPSEAVG